MLSDWLLRWRALFKRTAVERDISDELRFHLDRQVDTYVARGWDPADALRKARLELGGLDQVKEEYRDALGVRLVDGVWRDLRLAVRALQTTPIVTCVAIVSLGLGIGANTAMFSLVDSLLLRRLPVKDPGRLALLTTVAPNAPSWSDPVWEELRQRELFANLAAWSPTKFDLASKGETQFVDGLWASGSFFETLGVPAVMGRTFSSADDVPSGGPDGPVAVISYRFWQEHFNGAADVLGRSLTLDGAPFTIIGVTPPTFFGAEIGRKFDVVAPLSSAPGSRGPFRRWLIIVARLTPTQTLATATASLRALQPQIREATLPANASGPARNGYLQDAFTLVPAATGPSSLRRQYERPLLAVMVVVILLMLVACGNIANLLLARAAARRHEFSVRLALGASRWQLARHVLAESVVLAAGGTVLGILLASWGSAALVRELAKQTDTQSTTAFLDPSLNWHVFAFTMGAALVTVLLFGVGPAVRASRGAPMATIKHGRGMVGESRARLSSSLVVVQLTLSLVLLVAAGLFVRTFTSLVSRPMGFDSDRVLVATVSAQRTPSDAAQRLPAFTRALHAVRGLATVADAAASLTTPVSGASLQNQINVVGVVPVADGERRVFVNHVSPGWFLTLGTPLLAGRDFADADGPGSAPVAIVNEAFARKFLDGASPLGHAIAGLLPSGQPVPIIGVARDAVYQSLRDPLPPTVYLPFAQSREVAAFNSMSLSIRSRGRPSAALVREVTAALNAADPHLTWTIRPLREQIDASITHDRVTAVLSALFGALALVLAGLGLYGVTAYGVSRRRAEIGLRMALGASAAAIVRLVVSRVLILVSIGVVTGTVASVWLARFIETLLYGLEPHDPTTLLGAVLVLMAIGLAAGALPATWAARIQPATVLREI